MRRRDRMRVNRRRRLVPCRSSFLLAPRRTGRRVFPGTALRRSSPFVYQLQNQSLPELAKARLNSYIVKDPDSSFAQKNYQSSSPKEPPPRALTEPDVNVSAHPAPIVQPLHRGAKRLCLVQSDPPVSSCHLYRKLDDASPSLQSRYRTFITTTGRSAPVLCFGTLILVGPPLVFLPCHQSDRFPRYTQKPVSSSRHLHAGGRSASKKVTAELIPE